MATASRPYLTGSHEIKLEYGVAQVFAPKFVAGKNCGDAKFPPYLPRVLFTAMDDRKLWMDAEDGSDLERGMRDLGIRPGDFIRVTKVRNPRGGGHSIRVERVDEPETREPEPRSRESRESRDAAPPSRMEAELEKSLELARRHGPGAFITRPAPDAAMPAAPRTERYQDNQPINVTPAPPVATMTALVAGALIASIDAYLIAAEYAKSKNIPVELRLEFNAEDVRQSATSCLIEYWRDGGTR